MTTRLPAGVALAEQRSGTSDMKTIVGIKDT